MRKASVVAGLVGISLVVLAIGPFLFARILAGRRKHSSPPDKRAAMAAIFNAQPKFAVEMPHREAPSEYVTLRGDTGVSSMLDGEEYLRPIAGGVPNKGHPSALNLEYKVEGESVHIAATVFYGDFDIDNATPESRRNIPHKQAGVYSGKLNDSVRLAGMARVGLEPLTLKIVPAKGPASVRPQTISRAPAIQMEIIGEDRTFYEVALRNLSTMAVTAFHIDMPEKDGGGALTSELDPRGVIEPGGTHLLSFGIPHSGRVSNGVFVGSAPPMSLVLEAAVFKDGSYQGDVQAAAEIAASRIGREIQRQRVDVLIEAILADGQADDNARVKGIRSGIAQLAEEPDADMVASVRSRFPGLSEQALEEAKRGLKTGLHNEKWLLTSSLQNFEHANSPLSWFRRAPHRTDRLALWWSDWKLGTGRAF
jgi:hypothetical protein